jgi:hypothetical protein
MILSYTTIFILNFKLNHGIISIYKAGMKKLSHGPKKYKKWGIKMFLNHGVI